MEKKTYEEGHADGWVAACKLIAKELESCQKAYDYDAHVACDVVLKFINELQQNPQ